MIFYFVIHKNQPLDAQKVLLHYFLKNIVDIYHKIKYHNQRRRGAN